MADRPTRRYRFATAADIPALTALVNRAFAIEEFLEGTRTSTERLAASLEKGRILLAEDANGQLLASVYLEIRGERGYMGMLAVRPEMQRTPLAFRLAGEAERHLRALGCRALEISVLSQRPELVPLYRRYGFVETGTEAFGKARQLKPGIECHAILMSKPL